MSLYLLNLFMDQVDTLPVGRYCSDVLCCTIMTHLGDLEVKVMDLSPVYTFTIFGYGAATIRQDL